MFNSYWKIPKWAWTVELSQPLNDGKINTIRNGTQFPFLIPDENFHVGVGVGIWFSNAVYRLNFNIFILGALRKFKINNKACTSFKIEKIKLPLTMPHPRVDLLQQMPHPGEDKVVICPSNAQGGGGNARGWNWRSRNTPLIMLDFGSEDQRVGGLTHPSCCFLWQEALLHFVSLSLSPGV